MASDRRHLSERFGRRSIPQVLRPRLCLLSGLGLLVASLGSVSGSAIAGSIHPALEEKLSTVSAAEPITVLFALRERLDVQTLKRSLGLRRATRMETHYTIVSALRQTAEDSQGRFVAELERRRQRGEIVGFTPYWIANLVAVRARPEVIRELANHPDVDTVEPSFEPKLIEPMRSTRDDPEDPVGGIGIAPGLRAIRADKVWKELGITGEGRIVASLDTGVSATHPALRDRWRGRSAPRSTAWFDARTGGGSLALPTDPAGHGTHVMGIMTGLAAATGDTIGVAWGAEWIAANNLSAPGGSSFDNSVVSAYQWFADPDGDPTTIDDMPDVVDNSWGVDGDTGRGWYLWCDQRWWNAMDNCEAAGVVLIYSAGNSGPDSRTIVSPADRGLTETNAFAVGAVVTNGQEWPYPVWEYSSRGPSRCRLPASTKPELVAPGVDVYSSFSLPEVPYLELSGTSMSAPHVAGVVALMRQVNPDLDADQVKQILIDTARRYEDGEDNEHGWGMLDAYAAVLGAAKAKGLGWLEGSVRLSADGSGVAGAKIRLLDTGRLERTGPDGRFGDFVPLGTYDLEVSHLLLERIRVPAVSIGGGDPTRLDFEMSDRTGPILRDFQVASAEGDGFQCVPVRAVVEDFTGIESVVLHRRTEDNGWDTSPMLQDLDGSFISCFPRRRPGDEVAWFLETEDVLGNREIYPPGGEENPVSQALFTVLLDDPAEADSGWTLSDPEDTRYGRWEQGDPFGTQLDGTAIEPSDDHSPDGTRCFVTGLGFGNVPADRSDVDDGCVTLTSPVIDLTGMEGAVLSYWRWYAMAGDPDAGFVAEASADGENWTPLESLSESHARWEQATFHLPPAVGNPEQVQIRFVACDNGEDTIVEAAVDDIWIGAIPRRSPPPPGPSLEALDSWPNPFREGTSIRFDLPRPERVDLAVYDPAGRRVATLVSGILPAGENTAEWRGRDDDGRALPNGLYLYKLVSESQEIHGRLLLLR